jgi:hypothetical protein
MSLVIANGQKVLATHTITFNVQIQQVKVSITALVMKQEFGTVGIILGNNDLVKQRAIIDFAAHKIVFRKENYQNCMKLQSDVTLKPDCTKKVYLYGKVQKALKNCDLILKASGIGKRHMLSRQCVNMRGNTCLVLLINDTHRGIKLTKGTILANIDMATSFAVSDPIVKIDMQPQSTVMYVQECDDETFNDYFTEEVNRDRFNEGYFPEKEYHKSSSKKERYTKSEKSLIRKENLQKHPFLEEDDPKLYQTAEQIMEDEIDLDTDCILKKKGKKHFRQLIDQYQNAFSLFGEVGDTNHTVKLDLKDESAKYLRPYHASPMTR